MRQFEIKARVDKATEKSFFGLFFDFKPVSTLSLAEQKEAAARLAEQFAKDHKYASAQVLSFKMNDGQLVVTVGVN